MKTMDPSSSQGYTDFGKVVRLPISDLTVAPGLSSETDSRVERRSLKLYFDDIVAGEPSRVAMNSELVLAASHGDSVRVGELVTAGADAHTGNERALHVAAANGHVETVNCLLKSGADVHAEDDEALIEAAKSGYDDVVALLLEYGADVHARNGEPLKLASLFRKQTPGVFNARRETPSEGHERTVNLLRTHTGSSPTS
jgi:hypothetical protein